MVLKREFRGSSRKRSAASTAFEKGNSSLTLTDAVKFGDTKSLKRLLGRSDTDLEGTNDRGETALILAAMVGDMEAIRLLIESGADVNAKSSLSATALMAAAQNGDIDALRYLISKGADPDARKKDETTILMIAAMFGRTACVQALIAAGADVTVQDIYGYNALMLADGCEECEEALSTAMARVAEDKAAENSETAPAGTLKKAHAAAGKKDRKAHRAQKHKNPLQEKSAAKLTKPPT